MASNPSRHDWSIGCTLGQLEYPSPSSLLLSRRQHMLSNISLTLIDIINAQHLDLMSACGIVDQERSGKEGQNKQANELKHQ